MKLHSLLCVVFLTGIAMAGEVMERCGIAHVNGTETGTCYPFFSAVPALYFQYGGESYGAPLLTDGSDSNSAYYILEDWAAYLEMVGVGGSLIYFGEVDGDFKTLVQDLLPSIEILEYTGSDFEIARDLALVEWPCSEIAVIAPRVAEPQDDLMEAASAAAGWAANLNCPLLWTETSSLSPETEEAITSMGVSEVYLVDYSDTLSTIVVDDLTQLGLTVTQFSGPEDVLPATVSMTGEVVACMYLDDMQALPAAVGAARYGGYVLQLPEKIVISSQRALENLRTAFPMVERKQFVPVSGLKNEKYVELAARFFTLLDSLGGSDPLMLEVTLTFSTQASFPVIFERSINGDPSDPERAGAIPGRFPLNWIGNLGSVNRGALNHAVLHANPRPDHVTMSMNAYEVSYPDDPNGYFDDNWVSGLNVNEIFGWPEEGWTKENDFFPGWPPSQPTLDPLWPEATDAGDTGCCPGIYSTLHGEGYETHFHSGAQPGPGTHPSQPDVELCGFIQDVIDGSQFLYFSCHGGGSIIAVRDIDNGVAQDDYSCEFADPWWPGILGYVLDGSEGGIFHQDDLDSSFDNLHSVIIGYNACAMASGEMNEIALNHGAIGSIGSITWVTFMGSGWWWSVFTHLITAEDLTMGEALTYCNARISDIYTPPGYTPGADASLQYVLFGDPMIGFPDPEATPPIPSERHVAYGNHYPDGYEEFEGNPDFYGYFTVSVCSPARGTLSCSIRNSSPGSVELELYDIAGHRIWDLWQGLMEEGITSISFVLERIPAGVYFLRASRIGEEAIAKVVVLR